MNRDALPSSEDDPDLTPPGPFDGPSPDAGEPPWFVPDEQVARAPWQTAPLRGVGTDWPALERRHAAQLADAALHVGALDNRIRHLPPGVRRHLICVLVADLSWHLGARVTVDRLGLYMADRLGGTGSDAPDLARAAWALRRLDRLGGGATAAALEDGTDEEEAAIARWRADLPPAGGLHPFTRAAAGWEIWQRQSLSGDAAPVEGAVLAMLLGGEALRPGGLGVVPVSFVPALARRVPSGQLGGWLDGIRQSALAGLMLCDRLDVWRGRAARGTGGLSGRTPPRLIEALLEWPLASAPMLERATGASRAAVQRNMARLESLGLAEEITGQSRFRFWRPALDTRQSG